MTDAHALYENRVVHQRFFPQRYRFSYRVFSLLVNIDELQQLDDCSRFLSYNRFNLFSFHDADHGPRNGEALRPWIDQHLKQSGIDSASVNRVELFCFPRVLGYTFNPLSLWYCYRDDDVVAVLCEVSNTFGENHSYLLHEQGRAMDTPIQARKKKIFHVSPFMNMQQEYAFSLKPPAQRVSTVINEYENGERSLLATQSGERQSISNARLLWYFLRYPLVTAQVMLLIHWQALKIWLRGGQYHPKPQPPEQEIS